MDETHICGKRNKKMTVQELIKELSEHEPNAPVVVDMESNPSLQNITKAEKRTAFYLSKDGYEYRNLSGGMVPVIVIQLS